MDTVVLKRLTGFAWGHEHVAPEVWVNPAHVAYVQPRVVTRQSWNGDEGGALQRVQDAHTGAGTPPRYAVRVRAERSQDLGGTTAASCTAC